MSATYVGFQTDQTTTGAGIPAGVLAGWAAGDNAAIYFGGDGGPSGQLTYSNLVVHNELLSDIHVIPEPSSLMLFGLGAALLRRKSKRK